MADVITVTALNRYVKSILESDAVLPDLAIRGEVTNFVNHQKSGHWYFTLRDERASVKAVMFRQDARRLGFVPQDGMRVVVRCRVSLYETTGSFQIYVNDLFPDGVGAAQLALDQLKERLAAEGLFASEHKVPIPAVPSCIGIVTSATGAAIQDVRNILSRRWPMAKLLLAPVNVQGESAAEEICRGIRALDASKKADVILVTRGGGSREDLWVFNDERIARAAYACKTPLISAVGHEIDYTILDFVADVRAPTPSAAAELAVPDAAEEICKIRKTFMNIHEFMQKKLDLCYNRLNDMQQTRQELTPQRICEAREEQLQAARQAVQVAGAVRMERSREKLSRYAALAQSLSPYAVLGRGYAIVRDENGNCCPVESLKAGDAVCLSGQQADALCRVEQVKQKKEQNDEKAEKL